MSPIAATPAESARDIPPIEAGSLRLVIADADLVERAQALRYRVFYEEMGAEASPATLASRRDADEFDPWCDHLVVLDTAVRKSGDPAVVGTYRLLHPEMRRKVGHFYSEREYDLAGMFRTEPRAVELGRSCVDAAYRRRAVMHLLWRGIISYVEHHDLHLLFGCASFHGSDPLEHREPLSYLHRFHLAPDAYRPHALPEVRGHVDWLEASAIDQRRAFAKLPALIKGYARLGAWIGDGAVIDAQYNTTDVCIVMDRTRFTQRFAQRYGLLAGRARTFA